MAPGSGAARSTCTFAARRAYEIADRFRAAGVKVVIGGCHATMIPTEAAAHAAKALFRELIPLKLRWTGQASLKFAGDQELMDLMVRSGCAGLVVGFESLNPVDLATMRKPSNLAYGSYDEVVERIRDHGIMLWAAFLLGYFAHNPLFRAELLKKHDMVLGYRGLERD